MRKDKKKSTKKKLVSAAAMLALSAAMLGSSTYAWFTMNKEVEVTGMELKTKVSGNLLICSDNVDDHYSSLDLVEGRMGLLEPVSSINGTTGSFYYTVDATARGTKQADNVTVGQYNENVTLANTVAGKVAYDGLFNKTYNIGTPGSGTNSDIHTFTEGEAKMTNDQLGAAYGYIDYVFYLKATTDAASQSINMTECNLIYNDGSNKAIGSGTEVGTDIDRAWRIAVFAQKLTSQQGGKGYNIVKTIDPAVAANQKAVLGLEGSNYFTAGKAQNGTTADALANVVNFKNGSGDGVVLDTITATNTTAYYKVLVRVWLEGEDDTCNSRTYAALQTGKWALNCKFELGNGTAVNKINSDTAKTANTTNGTQSGTNVDDVAKSGS
jgi:hypothetical protein